MSEFEIRPIKIGDEKGITELLKLVFHGWPHFNIGCNAEEHFKWKYFSHPIKKKCGMVVLNDDNKIIGFDGTIPQNMKIGENNYFIGTSTDVAIDPDYRGKGIYTDLRNTKFNYEFENGMAFHFDISTNPYLVKQNLRLGYPKLEHPVSTFVRINDINLHLTKMPRENETIVKMGYTLLKKYNITRGTKKANEKQKNLVIDEVSHFNNDINTFWNKVKQNYKFILEKDDDYLNWRYCDRRSGEYIIDTCKYGDEITGYIVYRINKHNPDYYTGFIVDLMDLDDGNSSDLLLKKAINYFDDNNINIISTQLVQNKLIESFKKYGFVDTRDYINLFFKDQKKYLDLFRNINVYNASSISYNFGNLDII